MELRRAREAEEAGDRGAELPPRLLLHVPQRADNARSQRRSDCTHHTERTFSLIQICDVKMSLVKWRLYLPAVCRTSGHPAGWTEAQQGRRARRETRGRGKFGEPHRGTRDGHTVRQDRPSSKNLTLYLPVLRNDFRTAQAFYKTQSLQREVSHLLIKIITLKSSRQECSDELTLCYRCFQIVLEMQELL